MGRMHPRIIVALGAVAAWGVVQSVAFAVIISLLEVSALVWIVAIAAPACQHACQRR